MDGTRLPNECLLLVIQAFASDLKTLRKLLLVNRFFFRVTVPLMLDNPVDTWDMTNEESKGPSMQKLIALLFASVVSYNRALPPTNVPNPVATARHLTTEFLKPFNLQVADLICMPTVKYIMKHPRNKTTIDYSRHFKTLQSILSSEILYSSFVQLHRPPPEAINGADHHGLLAVLGGIDQFYGGNGSDEGSDSWEDENESNFDSQEESYEEEGSEECSQEDLHRSAKERNAPKEPAYSKAVMKFARDFGQGFAQHLALSPIDDLEDSGDDDLAYDNSDDSRPKPWRSYEYPDFGSDYWALTFDESSANYFNDFGFISMDKKSNSGDDDSDNDEYEEYDDDGLDPMHKEVRKLGKRTYDKWRLTNMQQMSDGYCKAVSQAVVDLLLQYNTDIVTDIRFHIKDAYKYIGVAARMPRLKKVFLARDKIVPLKDLEDTKRFLRTHREAFPEKRNIALIFGPSWDYESHYRRSPSSVQRRVVIDFERPRMELYEAARNVYIIIAEGSPNFYENCKGVDLSRLHGFRDNDEDRFTAGEGPAQEQFLRQCTNLRWIVLTIDSPQQLAWMLQSTATGGPSTLPTTAYSGQSQKPFATLGKLCLLSNRGSTILLHAANTAMQSLNGSTHLNYLRIAGTYEREREDEGSEGLVLSTTMGGWNLPAIRSMEIDVQDLDYLHFESLDQCPLLERLRLSTNPILVGNPHSQSQPSQLAICQPWILPRLQLLQLCNAPALLFNYDSLKSMPLLKVLVLTATDGSVGSSNMEPMWRLMNKIPRLAAYLPLELRTPEPTHLVSQEKWIVDWNLPNLSALIIRGPPAMTFSMDWLKCCPALDRVVLKIEHSYSQPLPLHADNSVAWITSPEKSRLREFTLQGQWALGESDLTTFLTDYAPNLVKLEVDRIHKNKKVSASALLKAINHADRIVLDKEQQLAMEADPVEAGAVRPEIPHRKLIHVVAQYDVRDKDMERWKIKTIPKMYKAKLREHHIRVYEFNKKHMVSGRTNRREIVALGSKSQHEIAKIFSQCRDSSLSRYY
ncbi:hypothetical protein CPB97_006345 [Podila verticillata]|nr:hypothetical protein CPB97_006345 [Podila verticillata]